MPSGYLAAEFLEVQGNDFINLPFATQAGDSISWQFDVQYTQFTTGKQAEGKNGIPYFFCGVNGSEWYWGVNSSVLYTKVPADFSWHKVELTYSPEFTGFKVDSAVFTAPFNETSVAIPEYMRLWLSAGGQSYCHNRKKKVVVKLNNDTIYNLIPCVDAAGKPAYFNKVNGQVFNSYYAKLIVGMTCKQALQLAKLPSSGGSLTVSLPWEAQLDKKVDAALSEAKAKGWTIVVQYQEPNTTSAVYNKYATCKTYEDVVAVNADYINDLTAAGEWIYPMPEITRFPNLHNSWWFGFFKGSKIKKIKATFPKCTYSQAMLGSVSTVEEVDLEFPVATHVGTTCENCDALRKVRIIAPKATRFDYNVRTHKANKLVECELYAPEATNIECLVTGAGTLEEVRGEFGAKATNLNSAFANCPKLKVFPTNYPKASTASGMFSNCQLPKEAAIAVLNSLPTYTNDKPNAHPITMGIHKDFENDPDVLAAIALADIVQTPTAEGGKGWAVTVQWNGTATAQTASTFGLRRKPIYAKLTTLELSDGTTETSLDWGHYVTNWEERGYQEFASVEEAKEYFNIED